MESSRQELLEVIKHLQQLRLDVEEMDVEEMEGVPPDDDGEISEFLQKLSLGEEEMDVDVDLEQMDVGVDVEKMDVDLVSSSSLFRL